MPGPPEPVAGNLRPAKVAGASRPPVNGNHMKLPSAARVSLAVLAVCLLASCAASTPQSRIARHPDLFQALTPAQQDLVARGRIDRGLPRDGVMLAWGRPDRVVEWDRSGSRLERWTYLGLRPIHTYSVGWGSWRVWDDWSNAYFFGGPSVEWVPYPVSRVDFRHGVVTDWEVRLTRP